MPGRTRARNLYLAVIVAATALGGFASASSGSATSGRPSRTHQGTRIASFPHRPATTGYKYVVSSPFAIAGGHAERRSVACPASAPNPISGEFRMLSGNATQVWPSESYEHGGGWVTELSNDFESASAMAEVGVVCASSSAGGYPYRFLKGVTLTTGHSYGAAVTCPKTAADPISGQFSSDASDVYPYESFEYKDRWHMGVIDLTYPGSVRARVGAVCGPSAHGYKYVVSKSFILANGQVHEGEVKCPASAPHPISGQFESSSINIWPRASFEVTGGWVTELVDNGTGAAPAVKARIGAVCVA